MLLVLKRPLGWLEKRLNGFSGFRLMEDTILPLFYTTAEGGDWQRWPGSLVALDKLRTDPLRKLIFLNRILVHSLAFEDPSSAVFSRWDAINGWTTPTH